MEWTASRPRTVRDQDSGGISTQLRHCCPAPRLQARSTMQWLPPAAGSQEEFSTRAPLAGASPPVSSAQGGLPDTLMSQFSSRCCDITRQKVWNGHERPSARDIRITGDERKKAEWKGHQLWADLGSHSGPLFDHLGSFKHLAPVCASIYINDHHAACLAGWRWISEFIYVKCLALIISGSCATQQLRLGIRKTLSLNLRLSSQASYCRPQFPHL